MPAPHNPNTAPATAALVRRSNEKRAAALRAAGWVVVPPEHKDVLPELPEDAGLAEWLAARGLPRTATLADLIQHERAHAAAMTSRTHGRSDGPPWADLAPGERHIPD